MPIPPRQIAPEVRRRTMKVWGLTARQAQDTFGALQSSTDLQCAISDLTAATDLLVRYLKADRIPAVVRKQIPALGGVTLVSLLKQGDTKTLLTTCGDMFRFEGPRADRKCCERPFRAGTRGGVSPIPIGLTGLPSAVHTAQAPAPQSSNSGGAPNMLSDRDA